MAARKKVLLLGASGLIAPHITPALERCYDLVLADVKAHPDGRPVRTVDVRDYGQVRESMEGVDAVMNFTVLRHHDALSFQVNTVGAWNIMKAAVDAGISKVIHTGPAQTLEWYGHEMDISVDAPDAASTDYYLMTKHLSNTIVKSFALYYRIQTVCYLFQGLGPKPAAPKEKSSVRDFIIIYDDLANACRLGLELSEVPGFYQAFNLHSHYGPGKYSLEKAKRILGYEPLEPWWEWHRRPTAGRSQR